MNIGPVQISFALPFFIFICALTLTAVFSALTRNKFFLPHSHGVIKKSVDRRSGSAKIAHVILLALSIASIMLMASASLNPRTIQTSIVNYDARRICIVFDGSGSMTIGFDDTSSPLPSYEKTRMGQAGLFIQKLVEKRQGDQFCLIFFDDDQYVSRDFTSDTKQVTEVLSPATLVGVLNLEGVAESVRIKQGAEALGTQAVEGLEFAKEFIYSHKDYNGDEIIIYVGDLTLDSAPLDTYTPKKLMKLRKEYGIKTYAVAVVSDYSNQGQQEKERVARQKLDLFAESDVPVYRVDDSDKIQEIADRIAADMPPSKSSEETTSRKSLAPWLLALGFIVMCVALIINEKFPKIP